jgi:hypothetical protein
VNLQPLYCLPLFLTTITTIGFNLKLPLLQKNIYGLVLDLKALSINDIIFMIIFVIGDTGLNDKDFILMITKGKDK